MNKSLPDKASRLRAILQGPYQKPNVLLQAQSLDENQIVLLNKFSFLANSMVFIYTPGQDKYLYISPNVENILGHSVQQWQQSGLRFFIELLHTQELDLLVNMLASTVDYYLKQLTEMPNAEIKLSLEMRLRCVCGAYLKFVQNTQPYQIDKEGNVLSWLCHFQEITHLTKDHQVSYYITEAGRVSKIYRANLKSRQTERIAPFTPREIEVLMCLAQGKNTRQIAEKLNVAQKTIESHRKKLIQKTGAKDATSMVAFYQLLGLLPSRMPE